MTTYRLRNLGVAAGLALAAVVLVGCVPHELQAPRPERREARRRLRGVEADPRRNLRRRISLNSNLIHKTTVLRALARARIRQRSEDALEPLRHAPALHERAADARQLREGERARSPGAARRHRSRDPGQRSARSSCSRARCAPATTSTSSRAGGIGPNVDINVQPDAHPRRLRPEGARVQHEGERHERRDGNTGLRAAQAERHAGPPALLDHEERRLVARRSARRCRPRTARTATTTRARCCSRRCRRTCRAALLQYEDGLVKKLGELEMSASEKTRVYMTGACDGIEKLREMLGNHEELELLGWSEHVAGAAAALAGGHLAGRAPRHALVEPAGERAGRDPRADAGADHPRRLGRGVGPARGRARGGRRRRPAAPAADGERRLRDPQGHARGAPPRRRGRPQRADRHGLLAEGRDGQDGRRDEPRGGARQVRGAAHAAARPRPPVRGRRDHARPRAGQDDLRPRRGSG